MYCNIKTIGPKTFISDDDKFEKQKHKAKQNKMNRCTHTEIKVKDGWVLTGWDWTLPDYSQELDFTLKGFRCKVSTHILQNQTELVGS